MSTAEWWDEARRVAEDSAERVRTLGRAKVDPTEAAAFVHRFLLRAGLIIALEPQRWLREPTGRPYWASLCEAPDVPYRFDQRLSLLFFSGLGQPSRRARQLVRSQIGDVPYLGTGLFDPDTFESDQTEGGAPAMIPEPVVEWIRSDGAARLATASLAGLATGSECWDSSEHVHDPECGRGDRLAEAALRIASASNGDDRLLVARLDGSLSGLDSDVLNVQTARFRIALIGLASQSGPEPVPLLDLRRTVRVGVAAKSGVSALVEGARVEFKAAFDWNPAKGQRSGDLQAGVLRTIAAFLNTEGGSLYIGVSDDGTVTGIEEELATLSDADPRDVFEGRIREALKNHVEPLPLHLVELRFIKEQSKEVIRIDVLPSPGITYFVRKGPDGRLQEDVCVRDGNRTLSLSGRARDQFVVRKSGG
ncbi:MAG: ATP-binding protein [Armatimonadetes bacterium]|nr:ATP-binding protein [Armatimonadota bacterium]